MPSALQSNITKDMTESELQARLASGKRIALSTPEDRASRPKAAPPMEMQEVDESELSGDDIQLRALFEGTPVHAVPKVAAEEPNNPPSPPAPPPPSQPPAAATVVPAAEPPAPAAAAPLPIIPSPSKRAEEVSARLDKIIDSKLTGKTEEEKSFVDEWRSDLRISRKERLIRRVADLRAGDEAMTPDDDPDVLDEYANLYEKIGSSADVELAYAVVRSRKLSPENLKKLRGGTHTDRQAPSGPPVKAEVAPSVPPSAGGKPASPVSPSGEKPASPATIATPNVSRQERDRLRMSKGGSFEQAIREAWGK